MSHLYLIGADTGPCFIGHGRKPQRQLEAFVAARPGLRLVGHWPCRFEAGAELAHRLARAALEENGFEAEAEWWPVDIDAARMICEHVADLVNNPAAVGAERHRVMLHLRENVFKTTQSQFALILGVSNSQVSRWESGQQEPGWEPLARLRAFAHLAHLEWRDEWLFEVPPAPPPKNGTVVQLASAKGASHG